MSSGAPLFDSHSPPGCASSRPSGSGPGVSPEPASVRMPPSTCLLFVSVSRSFSRRDARSPSPRDAAHSVPQALLSACRWGGARGNIFLLFGAGSFETRLPVAVVPRCPAISPPQKKALRGGGRLTGRQDCRRSPRRSCSVGFDFQASQSTSLRDGSRRFQMEGANRSKRWEDLQPSHQHVEGQQQPWTPRGEAGEVTHGPTISRPGPTLLMQAATAVNVVTRSNCSRDTNRHGRHEDHQVHRQKQMDARMSARSGACPRTGWRAPHWGGASAASR